MAANIEKNMKSKVKGKESGRILKEKWTVHVVPHFHFDVAWIKTYEEYLEIALANILDVLNLIGKEPDYRFCLDQVALLQPFLERYPEQRENLRKAIKDGKMELVCGMYSMPDANIPSGEFLVRQFLFGKKFMEENFGVDVQCGWMIDAFGHPAQMPQILKKCGFKYYVFGRGAPGKIPTEFYWEGIDGSRILTHWMVGTYVAGRIPPSGGESLRKIGEDLPYVTRGLLHSQSLRWLPVSLRVGLEKIESTFQLFKKLASTKNILLPNGGDFTPPQPQILLITRKWNKEKKDVRAVLSTPSSFFRSVEAAKRTLPTVSGEFNPVFQGVYGSRIGIKQKNREAENLLLTAEKFAVLASILGSDYPEVDLKEATRLLLFNHFHDIICGCGVDEIYEDAVKKFEESMKISKWTLKDSFERITERIDTQGEGTPVVVFNPLSWARTDVAKVEVSFVKPGVKVFSIKDHVGKNVPFQVTEEERYPDNTLKLARVAFLAQNVPAMGYKTYFVITKEKPLKLETDLKAGFNSIENEFFRVAIDHLHGGAITSIYDKENGREALNTKQYFGNVLVSETDVGDLYEPNGSADGFATVNTLKIEPLPTSENAEFSSDHRAFVLIEDGSVIAKITVNGQMRDLAYEQQIMLYRGIKRIDIKTKLRFFGKHKRVRICLPMNVEKGEIYHEIPFGVVKRGEGEYPAQNWIDYSNEKYGISLINRGLPGNNITKNVAFVTLLRSVDRLFIDHPSGEGALERGEHEFNYSIYPHKSNWKEAKSYKTALEFNNPLIAVKTPVHKGDLQKEMTFLSVAPENLVMAAVKKSEGDVVVRLYETTGERTRGRIKLFTSIKKAWITTLLEEKVKELEVKGKDIPIDVKPFKITTVQIKV